MQTSGWHGRSGRAMVAVVVIAAAGVAGWQLRAELAFSDGQGPALARAEAAIDAPLSARVTALGRLQPKDGVIRVAGPSQGSVVIARLLVDKGDAVAAGQTLAVLDTFEMLKTTAARLQVELENAQSELQRHEKLFRDHVVSMSERDAWQLKVNELEADIQHAQAEQSLALIRAPIAGRVLDVHARAGERVGREGLLELGTVDHMYAVAQVYETDITRVRPGQRATVTSPALPEPLQGTVERVGFKIGNLDLLDSNPVARTDARVVPVDIRLDDSARVAALTNLQVQVAIAP